MYHHYGVGMIGCATSGLDGGCQWLLSKPSQRMSAEGPEKELEGQRRRAEGSSTTPGRDADHPSHSTIPSSLSQHDSADPLRATLHRPARATSFSVILDTTEQAP